MIKNEVQNNDVLWCSKQNTPFFINNQKFTQSLRKSIICQTISKQFAGANKRRKLNNPLREQAKTLFLQMKPNLIVSLVVPVINYGDV